MDGLAIGSFLVLKATPSKKPDETVLASSLPRLLAVQGTL
jgi:hypothetical protein